MTLLMKLRPRDEMGLARGQWQRSVQNPDGLILSQVHFKQAWFTIFQEHGNWVQRGFLVPLGMS